jgi:hypothetical protein
VRRGSGGRGFACRLRIEEGLELRRLGGSIAQTVHTGIIETQAVQKIVGAIGRQQADLPAQQRCNEASGKPTAVRAQIHYVLPIRNQTGQPVGFGEELFDTDGPPVPKSENRSIVEIANQRNIGHDAPAGWKPQFIWPDAAECARSDCAAN